MAHSDFDEMIDRVGTKCNKWDDMQAIYGVDPADGGLAMWVADMDFRPPQVVQQAVEAYAAHGVYGYPGTNRAYLDAIIWWFNCRHGWTIEPEWISSVSGLVNGVAMAVDAFTGEGDSVVVMSPVYHAFGRVVRASNRTLLELPLAVEEGQYKLDLSRWETMMTGQERLLILCSPHNPGGRVWNGQELREIADFCTRHDLILVSDEIHCDLLMPGQTHRMMATASPAIADRLITLTAATKTFNIAGAHIGNAIIADDKLRKHYRDQLAARGISPAALGIDMVTAAYSPEGAAWVDVLTGYLNDNRQVFDAAINAIPGLRSMPLQATYLSWVDFSGTGMSRAEFTARVEQGARIASNHGISFGKGGESYLRFNLATPRARVQEAGRRIQEAFSDLQ